MVEIRKLQPSVAIRLPAKTKLKPNWKQNGAKKRTTRWRKDFPPGTPLDTPCVIWQGAVDRAGYGKRKIRRPDGREQVIGVHRWIIEFTESRRLGPKQVVLHRCDNPPCFRYDHLTVGTIQENNADRDRKGRTKQVAQHMNGETNGRAKLTRKQVALIKIDYSAGKGISALSREHGVSRNTIYRALRGLTWKEQLEDVVQPSVENISGGADQRNPDGGDLPPSRG